MLKQEQLFYAVFRFNPYKLPHENPLPNSIFVQVVLTAKATLAALISSFRYASEGIAFIRVIWS